MRNLTLKREWFAEEVAYQAGGCPEPVKTAFKEVRREAFLGPGPWQIVSGGRYVTTASDDSGCLYHNVAVVIDAVRRLNNGVPSSLAAMMQAAGLKRGERVVHLGAGVGYYTAILAEVVGREGSVIGIEIEPELAVRAKVNLVAWPQVIMTQGDGTDLPKESVDVVMVNAGAARLMTSWLRALVPGGRLIVPLTYSRTEAGRYYVLTRQEEGFRMVAFQEAHIYPCVGTQEEVAVQALRAAVRREGWITQGQLYPVGVVTKRRAWLETPEYGVYF